MSIQFAEVATGGTFFKPADFSTGVTAFLIEVERFDRQVPTNFGPKDTAIATLTVFRGFDGEPQVNPAMQIQQTALAKGLADLVGKATIVGMGQGVARNGNNAPWIWTPVDAEAKAKVIAYVTEREAKIAADVESAPSF